jgi:protease-4
MDRRVAWVLGIIFGGMFLCAFSFVIIVAVAAMKGDVDDDTDSSGGDKVGIVEVDGAIMDSKKVLKDLKRFGDASRIKAIVLRIDSPGGAVGPSQEIYDAVLKLKEKKKIVASMGAIAASGGYYIASATDKIYANPGTLTGSIGVVMELPNVQGLLKWAGVEMNTLTAGKMKASGTPFRPMTEDEKAYFLGVLADTHEQFIDAVAKGRHMKPEDIKPYADGRVFTGRQAKEYKLVDELGSIEAAVVEAGKLGGITGDPRIEYPKREKKFWKEVLGESDMESAVRGAMTQARNELSTPTLQYRMP